MSKIDDIRNAVAEVLEVEPSALSPETCLYDLPGFDSVRLLSLIVVLDDLGIEVPQHKAAEIRTFADVLTLAGQT